MKLVLLGTGGYHPNDRRQTACMLIPQHGIMLDAGTGIYRAAEYLTTDELDIFITHTHLDHVVGLSFLFSLLEAHRLRRVTVHATPDRLQAIDEHLFAEALFPTKIPFESRPLTAEVPLPGGGRLTHFHLDHPGQSRGYRLNWPNHSMAYVTDTQASPEADYASHIEGVDLLLHECYFRDDAVEWAQLTGHSCTSAVAQLARRARVGRLVLIHIHPAALQDDPVGLPSARAIFPATDLAEDRMELEF